MAVLLRTGQLANRSIRASNNPSTPRYHIAEERVPQCLKFIEATLDFTNTSFLGLHSAFTSR